MSQLLWTLALIFGSLIAGYAARIAVAHRRPGRLESIPGIAVKLQRFAITYIAPVVLVSTFWVISWGGGTLAFLPVLGVASHVVGGAAAFGMARWMRLERKSAGAMFTCGAFSNLLSFGGLASFMFYGEKGYALAMLFRMFETGLYYSVGFPVAKAFSVQAGQDARLRIDLRGLARDPLILRPIVAMVAGGLLGWSGLERPGLLAELTPALVKFSTTLMLLSVGLTLKVSAARRYRRECLAVAAVKFLVMPATLTLAALALGYARMEGGLPLKVVLTMSAMPVAFNSLIPPSLYGLDTDLAGSCWLFTTAMLAVVMPALYLVSLM